MLPDILNEAKADNEVITVLYKEINKLRRMLPMSLFQLKDGRVFEADESNLIFLSTERLQEMANGLLEKADEVKSFLPHPVEVTETTLEQAVEAVSEPAQPEAVVDQPAQVETPAQQIADVTPPTPPSPEQPALNEVHLS